MNDTSLLKTALLPLTEISRSLRNRVIEQRTPEDERDRENEEWVQLSPDELVNAKLLCRHCVRIASLFAGPGMSTVFLDMQVNVCNVLEEMNNEECQPQRPDRDCDALCSRRLHPSAECDCSRSKEEMS